MLPSGWYCSLFLLLLRWLDNRCNCLLGENAGEFRTELLAVWKKKTFSLKKLLNVYNTRSGKF